MSEAWHETTRDTSGRVTAGGACVWGTAGFCCRYTCSQLVEVNAHSLFSKWFSESGKLVSKLFAAITELVEEPQSLVFVLIDEVESLTAARKVCVGMPGWLAGWLEQQLAYCTISPCSC